MSRADVDWVLLRFPGEDGLENTAALTQLASRLVEVGPGTVAVDVERRESSASGERAMWVRRAFRPGALRQLSISPDEEVVVRGGAERMAGFHMRFDRARAGGLLGGAEAREAAGDWLAAHAAWKLAGQGDGPWCGYARVRAALTLAVLRQEAPGVRELLIAGLDACPTSPEALLRLAGWWTASGNLLNALACAAMADAVVPPFAPVPLLLGTGAWLVPARMAGWLLAVDPPRARKLAEVALRRGPPPEEAELLAGIAAPFAQRSVAPTGAPLRA